MQQMRSGNESTYIQCEGYEGKKMIKGGRKVSICVWMYCTQNSKKNEDSRQYMYLAGSYCHAC